MADRDYEKRFLSQHNSTASTSGYAGLTTPTKARGGDRFIPLRCPEEWALRFPSPQQEAAPEIPTANRNRNRAGEDANRTDQAAFRALLKNELLQSNITDIKAENTTPTTPRSRTQLFKYSNGHNSHTPPQSACPYSLSPLTPNSQKLLRSPRKATRKIPRVPYKVLDAPELQDDFYLNLVDWSSQNVLSVGLAASVYLWSACTSQVTKLCDLAPDSDSVTAVNWSEKGDLLAIGSQRGLTLIYDVTTQKRIATLDGHASRIGCLAWNGDLICSGSRDRLIIQRDIRVPPVIPERRLTAHKQEVCGLKWSPDHQYLASGGNDNQLLVWSLRNPKPVQSYVSHVAAVKAISWSPHHHGLLVSGGGTADRCMKFWNTLTGQPMQSIDTGSQVCNIAWSKHSCEIVSTHGYSQNQIVIWKYPSLQPVAKLTGHTYRVLYLAMSPDGESIVTGAGDETLRFWRVFSKQQARREARSALNLFTSIR